MNQLFRQSPTANLMLERMPESVRAAFTPYQIQAIESALIVRPHAVDIRLTIPFFGRGAYIIVIAGCRRRMVFHRYARRQQTPEQASLAPDMSQLSKTFPYACRLFEKMPEEIGRSFTLVQISAMDGALAPRTHAVDLRSSVPFFSRELYVAFLSGRNRRAYYRDLQNRNRFVLPVACASVAVSVVTIFALIHLKSSALLADPDPLVRAEPTFYPAVVPFKTTREECEKSDRQWIDDQCIDSVHDPAF